MSSGLCGDWENCCLDATLQRNQGLDPMVPVIAIMYIGILLLWLCINNRFCSENPISV